MLGVLIFSKEQVANISAGQNLDHTLSGHSGTTSKCSAVFSWKTFPAHTCAHQLVVKVSHLLVFPCLACSWKTWSFMPGCGMPSPFGRGNTVLCVDYLAVIVSRVSTAGSGKVFSKNFFNLNKKHFFLFQIWNFQRNFVAYKIKINIKLIILNSFSCNTVSLVTPNKTWPSH